MKYCNDDGTRKRNELEICMQMRKKGGKNGGTIYYAKLESPRRFGLITLDPARRFLGIRDSSASLSSDSSDEGSSRTFCVDLGFAWDLSPGVDAGKFHPTRALKPEWRLERSESRGNLDCELEGIAAKIFSAGVIGCTPSSSASSSSEPLSSSEPSCCGSRDAVGM